MTALIKTIYNENRTRLKIVLDHPKGNVITTEMAIQVRTVLASLQEEHSLRMVSFEGSGGEFSFGASVQEHAPGLVERMLPEMHRLIGDMLETPAPTAAVVKGRCIGGGFELALACDFIFASEDAVFGIPEVALAVFPPAAAALLPLRVGHAHASRAILTGTTRPAKAWHEMGLVTLVAPEAELDEAVDTWFDQFLAVRSATGLRHAVTATRLGLRDKVKRILPDLERLYLNELMRTTDVVEAVTAFLDKRSPQWSD